MEDGTWLQALRVLAAALALRVALIVAGVGQYLVYRVEASTPANSLLTIREGVALLGLGISPYSGSACHVPPLLLWLLAPTALHTYLYALPNIVCDTVGALMLRQTAQQLMQQSKGGSQQRSCSGSSSSSSSTGLDQGAVASSSYPASWVTPNTVMALYLLNPFTVASCTCGSTSPVENLAALASLWRATAGDAPGAAFGVALATYLGLHPIILLVPVALLTAQGPEDCTGAGQQQQQQQQVVVQETVSGSSSEGQRQGQSKEEPFSQVMGETGAIAEGESKHRGDKEVGHKILGGAGGEHKKGLPWGALVQFGCMVAFWGLCLVAISDIAVRHFDGQQCLLPRLLPTQGLQPGLGQPYSNKAHLPHSGVPHHSGSGSSSSRGGTADSVHSSGDACRKWGEGPEVGHWGWLAGKGGTHKPVRACWAASVYRLHLLMEDLTPNIGQMWYFFTEVFSDFRPFFRFVMHALCGLFTLPMALRFSQRPVLLATAQCLILCLFKPYPSVADHALYMALLPLLQKQLKHLQSGMLLVNSFLLLAVLEPAMWHQWINIESANSNFYYSITLLLGAWQVLLLVILLQLTVQVERIEKGKVPALA